MPLGHAVEQVTHGRLVGHVAGDELAVDLLRGGGAGIGVDVDAHHAGALAGEAAHGREADAASGAGHHRDPVGQTIHLILRTQESDAKKTFLTSVNECRASGPSSRPRPDCFMPPNGVQ